MPLYHYAPMKLGPGSIIEPGNFGRLLSTTLHRILRNDQTGETFVTLLVARELMCEKVRSEHTEFRVLPSRLLCIFGLPSLEDAQAYAAVMNVDGRQLLHEVQPINQNAATHVSWLSWSDYTPGAAFWGDTERRALSYWRAERGDPAKGREMLIGSAVQVVRSV